MTRKGSKPGKARKRKGRQRPDDSRRMAGSEDAATEFESLDGSEVVADAQGMQDLQADDGDEDLVEDLDALGGLDADEVLREIEALVSGRAADAAGKEGVGAEAGSAEDEAAAEMAGLDAGSAGAGAEDGSAASGAQVGGSASEAEDGVAEAGAEAGGSTTAREEPERPGGRLVGRPGATDPELQKPSRPEDRERLIAQALAHAEEQDARYWRPRPPAKGRWKLPLALALFALAGYLAATPPQWAQPVSVTSPISEPQHERGVRMALQLQAQEIEAFRAVHQRLPDSLGELSVRLPGVRWVRSSSRVYQLVGTTPAGETIVYDSARPAAEFRATRREMAALSRMNPPGEP
jgi:hypothetical protein